MRINHLVAEVRARLRAGKVSCFLSDDEVRHVLEDCMKERSLGKSRAALVDCAVAKVTDFCAELTHDHWRAGP